MQVSSEGGRPSGREVAELARVHIERHYASAVGCGTTSIATLLGVSSSLLCHRYRAAYGVTIGQHVRRLRIGKARELLSSRSGQLIKEVAADVGYCRQSYRTFLNAFRAETGMPPSRYQRQALAPIQATPIEVEVPQQRPDQARSANLTHRLTPASTPRFR